MNYFTENTDFVIPNELLEYDINIIKEQYCLFAKQGYGNYCLGEHDPLLHFCKEKFGEDAIVRYQVIENYLNKHIDMCEQSRKLNYIYELGGDNVITQWWNNDEVVESIICKPHVWYDLNVDIEHSVSNIVTPRLSITVKF